MHSQDNSRWVALLAWSCVPLAALVLGIVLALADRWPGIPSTVIFGMACFALLGIGIVVAVVISKLWPRRQPH